MALCGLLVLESPTSWAALARKSETTVAAACNPKPDPADIVLPMPCGLSMTFRLVAVPARGLLWDMPMRPGIDDSANHDRAFYDRRYASTLSGAFTLEDLPPAWRKLAPAGHNHFYGIARYEVSRLQWMAVMDNMCPPADTVDSAAALPATDMTWYDAVEFTRRYTTWLLQNAPAALPRFAGDAKNVGFLRLPTETEWEYAARGAHAASSQQLSQEDFFPLPPAASKADYAVYRPEGQTRAESLAAVGSRKPNPIGLHDTAGNAAEMVLDTFRFSLGGRLHGSAGGFVRKGGSFLSGESEILPGRREETPFFLTDGPAHARDLGFRPVISGINTPGGNRPQDLRAAWNKAGEEMAPLPLSGGHIARNPLEELDRLLAAAPDANARKNLLELRNTIKENNIIQERQKQVEAQSLLRTSAYMVEIIRNHNIRRKSLQLKIADIEKEQATARGADLEKLRQIMNTARKGVDTFDANIEQALTFYRSKVEEGAQLSPQAFADARDMVSKDFRGKDDFAQNMARHLALFQRHVDFLRKNRPLSRLAMKSEIVERRFQ